MKNLLLRICELLLGDCAIIPKADIKIFRTEKVLTANQIAQAINLPAAVKDMIDFGVEDLARAIRPAIMLKECENPENLSRTFMAQIIVIAPGANIE